MPVFGLGTLVTNDKAALGLFGHILHIISESVGLLHGPHTMVAGLGILGTVLLARVDGREAHLSVFQTVLLVEHGTCFGVGPVPSLQHNLSGVLALVLLLTIAGPIRGLSSLCILGAKV
jgi:hypothetical protein